MGFNSDFIEIAIAYTGSYNIEDLLAFLIKGDQGWEHDFIRNFHIANEINRCELCKDIAEEHFNFNTLPPVNNSQRYEEIKLSQERASLKYSFKDSEIDDSEICLICFDSLTDKWVLPSCGRHEFCLSCFIHHVEAHIKESKVQHIHCPGNNCMVEFTDDDVKKLVSEEYFVKYMKFKERAELISDPAVKWCTRPNCEGWVRGTEKDLKKECPKCGFELCFRCGKPWHPKKSCDQIVDEDYELWAKGREIQLCPKCKHKIEKVDGCNHMTCAACGYNWCWLCRGHYTSNHFNQLNPLGCPNLQSGYHTRQEWPMWKIYLARCKGMCVWFLIIVFLPMILLFGPAFHAVRSFHRDSYGRGCLTLLIYDLVIFIAVTIITPPGYAIAIPVLLIYALFKCYKRYF
jgi:hypothetical protein